MLSKLRSQLVREGVYKIRIEAQGKGKSGGYRMYIFIMEIEGILSPICIYSKNEKENLTFQEMETHLEQTKVELAVMLKNL